MGLPRRQNDTVTTLTKNRTIGAPIVACFNFPTLGDEADPAGVSWRFYADKLRRRRHLVVVSGRQEDLYGPDWNADVISPPSQFLTDVGSGKLAT